MSGVFVGKKQFNLQDELNKRRCSWFISEKSKLKKNFNFAMSFVTIISFFIFPINIGMLYLLNDYIYIIDIMADFLLFVDFLLTLISQDQVDIRLDSLNYSEVTFISKIPNNIKRYIRTYFFPDIISLIPMLMYWGAFPDSLS